MGFGRMIGFAPGMGTPGGFEEPITEIPFTSKPGQGSDDAYYRQTSFYTTTQRLYAGHVPGVDYGCGWRFRNIRLGSGESFTQAKVYYKAAASIASIYVDLRGERNVSPATFSTYADYMGRTRTIVGGRTLLSAIVSGTWYSVDVTSQVQEIIALAGWTKGNNLVIFFDVDTLSARRHEYWAYEKGIAWCAYLDVT